MVTAFNFSAEHATGAPFEPLSVVIVGAGIGGLSCALFLSRAGHKITVLESNPVIQEVGAGLQVAPNATRVLLKLGKNVQQALEKHGRKPQRLVLRRYQDGGVIGGVDVNKMVERYNSPHYTIARKDLINILLAECTADSNINLRLSSPVASCGTNLNQRDSVSVTLFNGETLYADLIVGADGLKSRVREFIEGVRGPAVPVGQSAYRTMIPSDDLLQHPDLASLVNEPEVTIWLGPGSHAVAYGVDSGYNLVIAHPANETHNIRRSPEEIVAAMKSEFQDWDPRFKSLISLVTSPTEWTLLDREPLGRWVDDSGKVTIMGDAAHPTLPYAAQGAALATEDAFVLSILLSSPYYTGVSDVPRLLRAFQEIRLERCTKAQMSARFNGKIFHLPDGEMQQKRDEKMRAGQFMEKEDMDEQFGWNGEVAVAEWWKLAHSVPPAGESFLAMSPSV